MISDLKGYKCTPTVFRVEALQAKGRPSTVTCRAAVSKYDPMRRTVTAENEPSSSTGSISHELQALEPSFLQS
ncbi:hypothetical protein E5288_WYG014810 [Bos mutus]|uniref:Uncharacterized protein n=1 Tax=Bos mutus TaxID=72004 RepID=A0A6B0S377_9CETA|nr:hypothetical protein [Bos mutus]